MARGLMAKPTNTGYRFQWQDRGIVLEGQRNGKWSLTDHHQQQQSSTMMQLNNLKIIEVEEYFFLVQDFEFYNNNKRVLDYSSFITLTMSVIRIVTIFMNLAIPAWKDQYHPHVNYTCYGGSTQIWHFGRREGANAILPPSCEIIIGLSCMLMGLFLLISKMV